ncbi:benzoate transport [Vibrio xiamenensis]|uniref:Benzoate transport n=1 Tax=Vibrio xiamenensis TaxID=861298 RepID=A0A1G7X0R4_9VIBR|nr:MFS transporter [Vibrio xiamenensis]SDG77764.1 benzoate transport [Vibrio xiamenensis]SDG89219.1 benzoate transport [Vibrio xiamenensis]
MTASVIDPRKFIDEQPMTRIQVLIVALTVLFSAVDGFDVLAIAVSGSGIMAEFGLDRAELGLVLSMELIGMAIGSIVLGGIADKLGRRVMLLSCLLVMASGMWAASLASSIETLSAVRIYTGLGIGGLLSSTNAVVAEFSNHKQRGLCISLMVIGYPLGGIACGAIGHAILGAQGASWRDMFIVGAWLSVALFPITWLLLPESVHWLTRVQPQNALARVNHALKKLGHTGVASLPITRALNANRLQAKSSILDIFSPALLAATLLMTLAYLFQMLTFYYILKWTPAIVVQMGIGAASAAGVLFWVNVGGVLGGLSFGFLSRRIGLKPLTMVILVLTSLAVALFGQSKPQLAELSSLAAAAGFFANAGVSGIYTLMAVVFPTHVRATGTGFVIGMGRAGAIVSPWLAGILMQQGFERGDELASVLAYVALLMGLCSLVAALCLAFLGTKHNQATEQAVA